MIRPETMTPMKQLDEEIQDIGMIDRTVRQLAEKVYEDEEDYTEMKNLIIEAFTVGMTLQISSADKMTSVEEENFEEDSFYYQKWQLELCRYMKDTEELACSEIKSNLLRKGLIEISDNFREG